MRKSIAALAVAASVVLCAACTSTPQIAEVTTTTAATQGAPSTTAATGAKDKGPSPEDESTDAHSTPKNEPEHQKGDDNKELSANDVVQLAIADIEKYWAEEMPDIYGVPYEPVSGGFHPYSSTERPPKCGTIQPSYEDVGGNAFYCDRSDLVAWDAEGLIPKLNDEFGSFAVALVFAHEWGHAVQARVKVLHKVATILTEQQADCFAGAWTRHVADGKSSDLELVPGALEGGMAALIELRDPVGELAAAEGDAHGNAFDRINAFQTGFDGNAKACVGLIEQPLDLTEVKFNSPTEAQSKGDMDPDTLITLVPELLNEYWTEGASATGLEFEPITEVKGYDPGESIVCNTKTLSAKAIENEIFVCVPDSYVAFDRSLTTTVYRQIGDWAVATLLAKQWVASVQAQNGIDDSTRIALLEGACFTGSFSRAVVDGVPAEVDGKQGVFHLSPGDLDEAVITFLTFSEIASADNKDVVTAFDKVRVFRSGFFGGSRACLEISAQESGGSGGSDGK